MATINSIEYRNIISEIFDLTDYKTKRALLFCNEAQKGAILEHIMIKIYKYIKQHVTDIDFGTIPKSKGDITKIENYQNMMDCLDSINELVQTYKDPTNTIREIYTAINNIRDRERLFAKSFALDIDFPQMTYNITVMSIISSISLLLASSIEFVKNGHGSFSAAFDKTGFNKSKDNLSFKYLVQFNKTCADKSIDKFINTCISGKNKLEAHQEADSNLGDDANTILDLIMSPGGAVLTVGAASGFAPFTIIAAIVGAGYGIVYLVKSIARLIGFYYKMRMSISDWFGLQAYYLQINAENLKYREDPKGDKHRNLVYQRQMKWVARFKKISNFFLMDDFKTEKEVDKEIDQSSKQDNLIDTTNSKPSSNNKEDSSRDSLF